MKKIEIGSVRAANGRKVTVEIHRKAAGSKLPDLPPAHVVAAKTEAEKAFRPRHNEGVPTRVHAFFKGH